MLEQSTDAKTEQASSTSQDVTAESSSAQTDSSQTQGKTLLEVVQEAAKKSGSKEESSTSEETEQEGSVREPNETEEEEQQEEVSSPDETEEEVEEDGTGEDSSKDVPFHNHPRWKEVVSERDAAKTQVAEYEAKVKELEPLVEKHKSIVDYCTANQISPDDFCQALEFLALVKSDPVKAKEKLVPIWQGLESLTGDRLPQDLQAEVDNNLLPLSRAQEIAKLRAQSTFDSSKHKQTIEQIEADKRQRFVTDAHSALQSWDSAHRKTDPDFAPKKDSEGDGKYEWFTMKLEGMLKQSPPNTTQDVINLAEKAYESACKSFSRFTVKKTPTKVLSSNGSSKTKQSQPKTIRDVVRQTASRHGIVMEA